MRCKLRSMSVPRYRARKRHTESLELPLARNKETDWRRRTSLPFCSCGERTSCVQRLLRCFSRRFFGKFCELNNCTFFIFGCAIYALESAGHYCRQGFGFWKVGRYIHIMGMGLEFRVEPTFSRVLGPRYFLRARVRENVPFPQRKQNI